MTGSPRFHIEPTAEFQADIQTIIARHAPSGRKGRAVRRDFDGLLAKVAASLAADPYQFSVEPWPDEWDGPRSPAEFRKVRMLFRRFRNDDAKSVRLMYLVDATERVVILVRLYTHAEYARRPPAAHIRRSLLAAIASWLRR